MKPLNWKSHLNLVIEIHCHKIHSTNYFPGGRREGSPKAFKIVDFFFCPYLKSFLKFKGKCYFFIFTWFFFWERGEEAPRDSPLVNSLKFYTTDRLLDRPRNDQKDLNFFGKLISSRIRIVYVITKYSKTDFHRCRHKLNATDIVPAIWWFPTIFEKNPHEFKNLLRKLQIHPF